MKFVFKKSILNYNYQSKNTRNDILSFEKGLAFLKEKYGDRVSVGWPETIFSENEKADLIGKLEKLVPIRGFKVNKDEYFQYIEDVDYRRKFRKYFPGNFNEKTLEHFIALKLLKLEKGQNFIDIAAATSPHYKIFSRLTGCKGYRHDIRFRKGFHGKKIGSDVSNIPVKGDLFHAALAACSIEHFEKDVDMDFMKEMARILTIGGIIVVIPLYLHKKEFCVTDPKLSAPGKVLFDPGVAIHCVKGWSNRHGRFYSPQTLVDRLINPNRHRLNFTLYTIENFKDIRSSVYCRFALVGQKKV
jgi:hypothetical protein